MEVTLKVNMIIGGRHYPFGTVLDEDEVPDHLRIPEYINEGHDTTGLPQITENETIIIEEPEIEELKPPPQSVRKKFGTSTFKVRRG